MSIAEYFEWYILYIPKAVYGWGLVCFLIVLAITVWWSGVREGVRLSMLFLLAEYVSLLLYFTVFIRRCTGEHEYILMPFWSYQAIFLGTRVLAQEIIMNIATFVPIGFLAGLVQNKPTWQKTVIIGLCISVTVELLQLVLERGCCETDDVINNTLGCIIGYWLLNIGVNINENK